MRPSCVQNLSPSEGVGNAGCPLHPQPRVQSVVARECSRHGRTGTPGIPARNGFNGLLRALPGDRAFLSPSPALLLADLTPASRRQDHTTSPSASAPFVCVFRPKTQLRRCCRVHRIPCPTFVTIAKRPSVWDGMAGVVDLIWVCGEAEYFSQRGWTANQ